MNFTGVGVALVTPFIKNKVNYDVLKELLDFHMQNGTDYVVLLGSTAEAATMSLKEKKALIEFAVSYVNKRIPLVVGTGTNDTKASISFSKLTQKLGADGLLVVTPYYNKPSQKGLVAHFKKIAQSVSIPVILYNVPSRTGINMEAKTVFELSKVSNIIGIKEASGNLNQVAEIIKLCGPNFVVLSGNDDQTLDVLKMGGHGTISVTANIIPAILSSLVRLYKVGNNVDKEFLELNDLNQILFIETNPVPVKAALNHMGFNCGKPRLPLLPIEKKNDKMLVEVLKKYQLVNHG
ncbi:4-hydroxy-tetrahydrodipicolinate synthase [Acholeplasma equirhinis]|uniref:4-hydroxy-tetrahydrodipicolinate synthase n=1 Tax=Acholeplasma equirhinis TaxID=555393 RepID=UPI00197AD592|nr:4-hydroxy-tetrahydrodipicolinate synthase [Acholeplasma equirhinis]MBN3490447.1 4-hydroxy-tetrahydrodipicolinate synthase [Acholeplasma equirhinis]